MTRQPLVHSSISEYVPISCLWHLALNPFVLTENGNPSYGSQFNFLKWLSSSQNSWALCFLANITQTGVNSVFVRDHFQPWMNIHTLLHQNSRLRYTESCNIHAYKGCLMMCSTSFIQFWPAMRVHVNLVVQIQLLFLCVIMHVLCWGGGWMFSGSGSVCTFCVYMYVKFPTWTHTSLGSGISLLLDYLLSFRFVENNINIQPCHENG